MKKLAATICIVGTACALSACSATNTETYDSSASYASGRTAGEVDAAETHTEAKKFERVFKSSQSK